jgi:polyisoprenoid-binding protein YceI
MSVSYSILIVAFLLLACRGPETKENKNNAATTIEYSIPLGSEKYVIDTKESVLTWEGSMVFANTEEHKGYVYISTGELLIEKSQLVGGMVEINMNSIEYKDKTHKNSPIKHLKSPDFFNVEKFPISTFVITEVATVSGENIEVTGNLNIKGITQAITFPAKIEVRNGVAKANGKVTIDRTQWGIRYKSGTFYDNLADEAVSDDVEFEMKIVAKK